MGFEVDTAGDRIVIDLVGSGILDVHVDLRILAQVLLHVGRQLVQTDTIDDGDAQQDLQVEQRRRAADRLLERIRVRVAQILEQVQQIDARQRGELLVVEAEGLELLLDHGQQEAGLATEAVLRLLLRDLWELGVLALLRCQPALLDQGAPLQVAVDAGAVAAGVRRTQVSP